MLEVSTEVRIGKYQHRRGEYVQVGDRPRATPSKSTGGSRGANGFDGGRRL